MIKNTCRAAWLFVVLALFSIGPSGSAAGDKWVATWTTALVARPPAAPGGITPANQVDLNDQTLRQIVHTTIGGSRVRVVISNAFGTAPLAVGAAAVGVRARNASVLVDSSRPLLFGGGASVTVPPGAEAISDPADLVVPDLADLAIDLYFPADSFAPSSTSTVHAAALQTSYVSPRGNHAGKPAFPLAFTTSSWHMLGRVEVAVSDVPSVVVALGDSITDGTRSTADLNRRWPDHLAKRASDVLGNGKLSVLNAGIVGNRLLTDGAGLNALARLSRDVLLQTGATHVIVMEGINDIGLSQGKPPAAADLIWAHHQLVERAHAMGLKIYGATMTPFEGARLPNRPDYWTPEGEMIRQTVNSWIRSSKDYDAVIDFDAAVRDPNAPTRILPKFDSGDHLHPNDLGYLAMAGAVDLTLFAPVKATAQPVKATAPPRKATAQPGKATK